MRSPALHSSTQRAGDHGAHFWRKWVAEVNRAMLQRPIPHNERLSGITGYEMDAANQTRARTLWFGQGVDWLRSAPSMHRVQRQGPTPCCEGRSPDLIVRFDHRLIPECRMPANRVHGGGRVSRLGVPGEGWPKSDGSEECQIALQRPRTRYPASDFLSSGNLVVSVPRECDRNSAALERKVSAP